MGFSIGGAITDIFGSENKFKASKHQIDEDDFEYGNQPGAADEAATRYKDQAASAQGRTAPQAANTTINYGAADIDRARGQEARQGQSALAQAMQARAMGQTPSIAGMQAQQDMSRAQASQASMAASARGGAAAAIAQQTAANNVANAQGAISGQAQINAANERLAAENAASQAYGAIRGGDATSQAQAAGQAEAQANLTQGNNQFNTSAKLQQGQLNDAMTQGMTSNEIAVRNAQMTGSMNKASLDSANANAAQSINAAVSGQNANTNQANSMGMISTIASVAGGAAMSDERTKKDVKPIAPWLTDYMMSRRRDADIPDSREPEVVRSTWGAGPDREVVDNSAKISRGLQERNARDARAAGSAHLSGGMAVAGMSPGIRGSASDPMLRQDSELSRLTAAKELAGGELTEREQYDRDHADFRLENAKKADRASGKAGAAGNASAGAALAEGGKSLAQMAANVDTGLHIANSYTAPQLLAVSDERAKTPAQRAAYERGQQAAVRDLGDIDEAASREASRPVSMSSEIEKAQRAGRRDPVAFRRDDAADQARVKRQYQDDLGRRADAYQGTLERAMAQGPAVGGQDVIELDQQPTQAPAPWLVDYMLQQRAGNGARLTQSSAADSGRLAGMMVSDDRVKLAAAWDAGREQARQDAADLAGMNADELKARAEDGSPLARTILGARAAAWDEGSGETARRKQAEQARNERQGRSEVREGEERARMVAEREAADRAAAEQASADQRRRASIDLARKGFREIGGSATAPGYVVRDDYTPPAEARPEPEAPPPTRRAWGRSMSSVGDFVSGFFRSDARTKDRVRKTELAGAARSMAGFDYAYKPGFTPPEQELGERNVGPMAQNMARDPVARNIVKEGPDGLLMLDTNKMVKTLGAIVADQQRQHDEEQEQIATLSSRLRRRR